MVLRNRLRAARLLRDQRRCSGSPRILRGATSRERSLASKTQNFRCWTKATNAVLGHYPGGCGSASRGSCAAKFSNDGRRVCEASERPWSQTGRATTETNKRDVQISTLRAGLFLGRADGRRPGGQKYSGQ